jgi:aspartate dehydrogenase
VRASGHFGKLLVEVENTPSPANPKTGYIVAMSIIKQLRSYSEPFVTGV